MTDTFSIFGRLVARIRRSDRASRLLINDAVPAGGAAQVRRHLQVALGLVWLLDGLLQFQPFMFGQGFVTQVLEPSAVGQPAVIAHAITSVAHLIAPHVAVLNAFAATIQVLIGLTLLWRPTVKIGLLASFAWGLGIWAMGEGFGMLLTGSASPLTGAPGAALLYVLAGLMVWPTTRADRSAATAAGALGERGARIAWAALWLGSAALWLLPANRSTGAVHDQIAATPSGASWLSTLLSHAANAAAGHGVALALVGAAVSAVIGLGVLAGRAPRFLLVLSLLTALVYWVVGEGLGGIFTGSATDPNTGPLLALLAVAVYSLHPAGVRVPARGRSDERVMATTLSTWPPRA
jgi:hypothetical protein